MSAPTTKPTPEPSAAQPIVYPLDDFYSQAGRPLPRIEAVEGQDVPEPYKTLLVHQNDMTPTLEKFHGSKIHLQVLRSQQRGDFYFREVVLLTAEGKPVEFGAIKINLTLFPSPARAQILAESIPLGTLLAEYHVTHTSRPKAFLRLASDDFINTAFKLQGQHWLYGRRNTLWNPDQRPLAEIVEILPP
jgi:chorismate-pyruvate lyase